MKKVIPESIIKKQWKKPEIFLIATKDENYIEAKHLPRLHEGTVHFVPSKYGAPYVVKGSKTFKNTTIRYNGPTLGEAYS